MLTYQLQDSITDKTQISKNKHKYKKYILNLKYTNKLSNAQYTYDKFNITEMP